VKISCEKEGRNEKQIMAAIETKAIRFFFMAGKDLCVSLETIKIRIIKEADKERFTNGRFRFAGYGLRVAGSKLPLSPNSKPPTQL
jgi:hypothetical protein